jgi:hypothetical protein
MQKTKTPSGLGKKESLARLRWRRAHRPEQIDDSTLPAGSSMHYYCQSCGWPSDTKLEGWFLDPPKKLCKECQRLKNLGWLNE